ECRCVTVCDFVEPEPGLICAELYNGETGLNFCLPARNTRLREGRVWPPAGKQRKFDPERWCAETWSAVKRAREAFVPDGASSPPDLPIDHVAKHLNVKYGVGIRQAEEIASRTRKDAGLDVRRGRPKINSPAK